ncbi:V-containing nitrogenase subunit delta [Imhoffiella purpurea]|uniref:nitrogenase n=1 Tax=Imhoffiella purpurea TaxID=1249627 RepID=W9VIG4_9GAMM|nr:V-containing nitrogenase subunit delta [Imhoffiella purpurea]EXJ15822.1 Nitrogenase (vanadium-iron) delta chain [Imhoffiella purpurea]
MNNVLDDQLDELYGYIEERCLWQFFSRSWDRQENIDGVLDQAARLLNGKGPARETPMDNLFYADAKILVADLRERFPWLEDAGEEEIRQLCDGLKGRLVDVVITRSKNRELNHHLY